MRYDHYASVNHGVAAAAPGRRHRANLSVLMVMVGWLLAGTAWAGPPIVHGVNDGQAVSGPLVIWAQADGPATSMTIELTGPDTQIVRRDLAREIVLVPGVTAERRAGAWDASAVMPGTYTLTAKTFFRQSQRDEARVTFTVTGPPPTPPTRPVGIARPASPSPEPAVVPVPTSVADAVAAPIPALVPDAPIAGDPAEAVVDTVPTPVGGFGATFAADTPRVIRHAQPRAIGFTTIGVVPPGGDVLVLAWSHEERTMVGAFAHTLAAPPYEITPEKLALLPAGSVEVQLATRINGRIQETARQTVWVETAPDSPGLTMPVVAFAADTPATMTVGGASPIALVMEGTLPAGGDVLLLCWSHAEGAMLASFAHVRSNAPWSIPASRLNALPAGRYTLQAFTRLNGKMYGRSKHDLTLAPVTAPVTPPPGPAPNNPTAPPTPDRPADGGSTGGSTGGATPPPQTGVPPAAGNPAAPGEPGDASPSEPGDAGVTVSFAADAAATYNPGSGTTYRVATSEPLPSGADVLVLAWSDDQRTMVDTFAHVLAADGVLSADKLDLLPGGLVELQAMLRVPGQPNTFARLNINVNKPLTGPADELPLPPPVVGGDGFTVFNPSPDTRVVYLSSSRGDDSNSGLSPNAPVRSVTRAKSLIRDGFPDWLLIKAGDTFRGGLGQWTTSGRNPSEKQLVGVYGDGPRPKFYTDGRGGIEAYRNVNHVAFTGLEFYGNKRDPDSPDYRYADIPWRERGVAWYGTGRDVLIEDCKFSFYMNGLVFQSGNNRQGGLQDIAVRRSIILYSYTHKDKDLGGHAQGIYAEKVDGLLLEENLFDHSGWHPRVSGAVKTIFNHNAYIQGDSLDITARGNIFTRGSSHGLQCRPGGLVEDNLFVQNAMAFFVADAPSVVRRNVVLESNDVSANSPRGSGLEVLPLDRAVVENNIFADKRGTAGHQLAIEVVWRRELDGLQGPFEVTIRNNIAWKWDAMGGPAIKVSTGRARVLAFSGNLMDRVSGGESDPPFIDPGRNVDRYMASLNQPASLERFVQWASARPRGVWDPRMSATTINAWIRAGYDFRPYD